jgi:hypothetical protein
MLVIYVLSMQLPRWNRWICFDCRFAFGLWCWLTKQFYMALHLGLF